MFLTWTTILENLELLLKNAPDKLSDSAIISYIDKNSKEKLDLSKIKYEVKKTSKFGIWGKTLIKLSSLKIQDRQDIENKIHDKIDTSKPIVVNSNGFIIDGRHRALKLIQDGKKDIYAYIPITGK